MIFFSQGMLLLGSNHFLNIIGKQRHVTAVKLVSSAISLARAEHAPASSTELSFFPPGLMPYVGWGEERESAGTGLVVAVFVGCHVPLRNSTG